MTFARVMLFFAEFDLALATASGNRDWLSRAREDVRRWRGEFDRQSIQEQRPC